MMTKKSIKQLVSLTEKMNQFDAIFNFLNSGQELTVAGAKDAGIADPARVIYSLRCEGFDIYLNNRKTKRGEKFKAYRLAKTSPCK